MTFQAGEAGEVRDFDSLVARSKKDSADSGVKDIDRVMCLDAVEFERPIDTAPPRLHPVLKISSPASARGDYETIQNVPMSSSLAASV